MRKLMNSENFDCANMRPFYPNAGDTEVVASHRDNLPQACARGREAMQGLAGRLYCNALLRQIETIRKVLGSPPKVMRNNPSPTALDLLSLILELEFGESRRQHYGLFSDDMGFEPGSEKELLSAQLRLSAKLRALVESVESKTAILVVGDTVFELAKELAAANGEVCWFGSTGLLDSQLEESPNFTHGGDDFLASTSSLTANVVLLEGSIHYLDQMAILSKARDVLTERGRLILCGEFLLDDSLIEYSALPNLSSLKNLSRRLGFEQLEDEELSASAALTLEYVSPLIEKHGTDLIEDGKADRSSLDSLQTEFEKMQREFDLQRRCFRLVVLQKEESSKKEWVNAEYGDIDSFLPQEVAELFEKSFNVVFNEELWDWKYRDGNGKCVVARIEAGGDIMAHYGGAPRQISYFGKPSMAIQPCDVMVHPSIRKQYGKGSLFFEVAATFLEREIGNTVNHLLGFGFPNQKTMNISKRLGLYEKTDDFVELLFPHAGGNLDQPEHVVEDYDPDNAASREELNSLWESMRQDYADGIIGVRNADYIRYRYIDHPFSKTNLYRCVIIRELVSSEARAIAIIKDHDGGKLLMDLICPVAQMKDSIAILNQHISREEAGAILRAWVTKSGVEKLASEDTIVNELGIEIPCNSWNPGPSAELLYGAWWLTAGDMDFV